MTVRSRNMKKQVNRLAAALAVACLITSVGAQSEVSGQACTLETHHTTPTCPGPNPTNPGSCVMKTWNGAGCEAGSPNSVCKITPTIGPTQIQYGSCVNGACFMSGDPQPLTTYIDTCG